MQSIPSVCAHIYSEMRVGKIWYVHMYSWAILDIMFPAFCDFFGLVTCANDANFESGQLLQCASGKCGLACGRVMCLWVSCKDDHSVTPCMISVSGVPKAVFFVSDSRWHDCRIVIAMQHYFWEWSLSHHCRGAALFLEMITIASLVRSSFTIGSHHYRVIASTQLYCWASQETWEVLYCWALLLSFIVELCCWALLLSFSGNILCLRTMSRWLMHLVSKEEWRLWSQGGLLLSETCGDSWYVS